VRKEPGTGALALKRGPRESEKAYAAFREYVAIGPGRSPVLLAGKMRRHANPLGRWSVKREKIFLDEVGEEEHSAEDGEGNEGPRGRGSLTGAN